MVIEVDLANNKMLVLSGTQFRLVTAEDLVQAIQASALMKKAENIMEDSKAKEPTGITRREALKISGLALGGLAIGGAMIGPETGKAHADNQCTCTCPDPSGRLSQQYSYFDNLDYFYPFSSQNQTTTVAPLGANEMRITFMGSCIPPVRRAQQMRSVFVEVGWDGAKPLDQFVFDCGSGVCANYGAIDVGYGRMDKIFLAHLHGDHMSDLTHIYCFGPSADRKSPLYVWGPSHSGVKIPVPGSGGWPRFYDDGVNAFCTNLRAACRWRSESFSFQTTSYPGYPTPTQVQKRWGLPHTPTTAGDGPWGDAYAMVPIQLDWTKYGKVPGDNIACYNPTTGVKITHFPVIHTRKGAIGYKLEWWPSHLDTGHPDKPHLTMIYTSDTKPEIRSRDQAINGGKGVDVFIHEMVIPAQVWAMKNEHLSELPEFTDPGVEALTTVQNSSQSPQGDFGRLLSQINPRPRLTVATHFPVADDTVECALNSVQQHCPVVQGNVAPPTGAGRITWSFDLMVLTVSKDQIVEQKGYVSDFGFSPTVNLPSGTPNTPKYWTWGGDSKGNPIKVGNPYAQIDLTTEIPACDCTTNPNTCNYREDGY